MALAQQAEAPKIAALEGRILNAKTGQPLRRVNLTLRPNQTSGGGMISSGVAAAAPHTTSTDAEGKFRFERVDPGTYRLGADRQGFIRQEYGARQPMMPGTPLNLTAGQEMKDVTIKLLPHAVLTGHIFDEEGEAMARVQIQVWRRRYLLGKMQPMPMGGASTSDTGEFRIAQLSPGRYWVSATYRGRTMYLPPRYRRLSQRPCARCRSGSGTARHRYPPAKEPGVSGTWQGARLRPRAWAARDADAEGPLGRPVWRLLRRRGQCPGGRHVRTRRRAAGILLRGGNTMQGMMNVAAKVPVEIAKDHVEGVTIPLGTPVSLTGSLRVVGESQEKKSSVTGIRVQLSPMDGLAFNTPGANPREDGSFNIENLGPDKYRISAYNLPPGSWLQSVRTGDQEVLDTGLDLSGGSPASIQITLGRGTGQITGLVQAAEQKPAAGAMVALIAEPLQPERYDLNRVAWSD